MGKITGWGTVDSTDSAAQIDQLDDSANVTTEEPVMAQESEEVAFDSEVFEEPDYSSEALVSPKESVFFSQGEDPSAKSNKRQCQDLLIKEIDSLSLRFFEDENGETVFDISDFEAEAISLLLEYSKGKEEIDLFPIVQTLLSVKRQLPLEDETPKGINVYNCKSPNFDKLFASIKQALSICE